MELKKLREELIRRWWQEDNAEGLVDDILDYFVNFELLNPARVTLDDKKMD